MNPWVYVLLAAAYLYGSIPFGFLAARHFRGVDLRQFGSGNIGATNAARVLGFRFFPAIFVLDMSKGLAPTLLMTGLIPPGGYVPHPAVLAAGLAGILGHVFPIFLRFRGGKAVATGTGVFLVVAPWAVLVAAIVWGTVFAVTRYVSLASMLAATALPIATACTYAQPWGEGRFGVGFAALAAVFVIWLHRSNVRRLLARTEHKIGDGPDRNSGRSG